MNAPVTGSQFYDLRDKAREFKDVYSPTDYTHSQRLGAELRERGADGIAYDSVRREEGNASRFFDRAALARAGQ